MKENFNMKTHHQIAFTAICLFLLFFCLLPVSTAESGKETMRTKLTIEREVKKLLAIANSDKTEVGRVARCQAEALRWTLGQMTDAPSEYTTVHAHHIKAVILGPVRPARQ